MLNKILTITILALLTLSCKTGPDYIEPKIKTSGKFHGLENSPIIKQEIILGQWWHIFNDKLLNKIIQQTVNNNHDIRIALANIEQAKSLRRASLSAFFPFSTISAQADKNKSSGKINFFNSGTEQTNFNAGLDVSWELDIFGKARRGLEAANARLEATKEQKRAVLIMVLAETAQNYFQVRGLQKRIEVTKRNIELLKESEKLAKARFNSGIASKFDFLVAKGERQAIAATLPNLESRLRGAIYRICVLAGKPPEYYLKILQIKTTLPQAPDIINIGLRSEILRQRPDIKAAERNLAASIADIGVATANLFPSFSLIGSAGLNANLLKNLGNKQASTHSFGGNISWSILNFPAILANIKNIKAQSRSALINYEKTILLALEEAENSLSRYLSELATLKKLKEAQISRQKGLNIAKLLYKNGEENFLIILDSERSLIQTQDQVIQSETNILINLTQLYKALGGGWEKNVSENNKEKEN